MSLHLPMESSLIFLDDQLPSDNIFGAEIYKDFEIIKKSLKSKSIFLINLKLTNLETLNFILKNSVQINKNLQIIFFEAAEFQDSLISIINNYKIFKIHPDREDQSLFQSIIEAKSEFDLELQNHHLLDLIKEKNLQLQNLNLDLEVKIKQRQMTLEESKQKLTLANKQYTTLVQCLFGIQKSSNTSEIEKALVSSLAEPFKIKLVKIQFQNLTISRDIDQKNVLKNKLQINEPFEAYISYFKKNEEQFSKEDQLFLKQVSSAVSLAIQRFHGDQALRELKQQWQMTFDSILEPVCIVNENYELIQWNKSYSEIKKNSDGLCYKVLFQRNKPCENCNLGNSFEIPLQKNSIQEDVNYSVESQKISENELYLNIYRDLQAQKKIERQILESSKLSELGLIGSSIAHELNNPLAGLITFIQMMKSENDISIMKDIEDMEKAALRCKDIVQNLLSFTRKSSEQKKLQSMRDILNSAIRVLAVKIKPLGISIDCFFETEQDQVIGQSSALAQAFVNILQNSIESIEEKKKSELDFNPKIEVKLSLLKELLVIDVRDNGMGLSKEQALKAFTPYYSSKNPDVHRGLGLTTSYQIIKDHKGDIDIQREASGMTRVRVSFLSPVLNS